MSGIQSLLKYRFQKKDSEKLENSPPKPLGEQSHVQASPNSSQRSVSSVSKRGTPVITSDSDESPVKSAASSPWLSKASMIQQNHVQHKPGPGSLSSSQGSTSAYTNSQTSQSSQSSVSTTAEEDREKFAYIASLQDMFPNTAKNVIEEAIHSTATYDEAVDYMINYNRGGGKSLKRKFQRIRTISTDSESSPMKKKARPLESSQSSQETIILTPDSQPNSHIIPQQNGYSPRSIKEKVQFLQGAYPRCSTQVIEMTLKSQNYDLEMASEVLNTMPPDLQASVPSPNKSFPAIVPKTSPVSTISMGSIKDFKAARQINKFAGKVHLNYDDDGGDFTPAKGIGARVKVKGIVTVDDDDDDAVDIPSDDSDREDDQPSDPIFNFFNNATCEELQSMQGCSKKKAELITKIRPFKDWDELVSNLEEKKDLSFQLITSCKEVLRIRSVVNKLMNNCKRIASEMESIVADITSKTVIESTNNDKGYLEKQPSILNPEMKLKPYQMVGLNWLTIMHDQDLNGILGDEMGLGKTIQTVAFLAHMLENGDKGPHVIVSPSSTLDNWLRELNLWCPSIKVMLYYGSQEDRREVRAMIADGTHEEFHVVVTTYNMASGSTEDRALFKRLKFHYAIFDEGHMLKNMSSMRYQSLMKIRAARRLLLTGTPLQNNLVELMSLLAFVMPELFVEKADQIKRIFTTITSRAESKGNYEKQVIQNAKNILKPFFLRRLKRDVLQQLPTKTDLIEKVAMAFDQQELYDNLRADFNKEMNKSAEERLHGQAGSAMMMQLRKAANHHLLHRRIFDASKMRQMAKIIVKEPDHPNANEDYVFEDMEVMSDFELHKLCCQYKRLHKFKLDTDQIIDSGKFRRFDVLLPQLKDKDDRVLIFSQFTMMMDIMEEYMKAKGYRFLRLDGQTPVAERQELIDTFNTDPSIFVFLLSTKAGGLGINLTAANTVILHDIDFNPYNDKQAEDRCHRVGQTRDVMVYRFVSKNSIEEAMLRCAQAKLRLEQDVTGQGKEEEEDSDVASLLKEALAIEKG